jgi:beta-phosphoglucomutase
MERRFAVIFDMDGVLVENSYYHDLTWKMICNKYGSNKSAEEIKSIFGGTNKLFVKQLLNRYDPDEINAIAIEKEELYRQVYKQYIKLPDGLQKFLDDLKNNKILLAVATSAPKENLDFVLDTLNIRKYFDTIVDESFVKKGKPDPEVYEITARNLQMEPENCIVFEDSIYGIQSALAAGMKVVAITTTFNEDKLKNANKIIHSFNEIDIEQLKILLNNPDKK